MLKIDGECAICLESYQVGDVIAYIMYTCKRRIQHDKTKGDSIETTLGSINGGGWYHVYHKTCLVVQYLANRNISQKGLKDGQAEIPLFPTWRDPYTELLSIGDESIGQRKTNVNHITENIGTPPGVDINEDDDDLEPETNAHG